MKVFFNFSSIYQKLIVVFSFVMIALPGLVGVLSAGLILTLVIGIVKKHLVFKLNYLALLFFSLYLCYLIGSLYTNNPDLAYKYLEYKLSFLVFPMCFLWVPTTFSLNVKNVLLGFIAGLVGVYLLGFINSVLCFLESNQHLCFTSVFISPIHHPSYLMAFSVVALFVIWYGRINRWKYYRLVWIIPMTLLILSMHILTTSLAGILFLVLLVSVVTLIVFKNKFGSVITLISAAGIVTLILLMFKVNDQLRTDYQGAMASISRYLDDPSLFVRSTEPKMGGSVQRLILWTVSAQELIENPMGVGTGNVDEKLDARLESLGQGQLAKLNLNPHNQYLQTGVEIGVIGLLIFVGIIVYAMFIAVRQRNWILLVLLLNLMFNCLFESMLQRQSGIVFYTFWICLLSVIPLKKNELN